MSIEYTSPAWVNDKRPLLVAENLNALSNALVDLANYANGTAFVYPVEYGETTYNDWENVIDVDVVNELATLQTNGTLMGVSTAISVCQYSTTPASVYNKWSLVWGAGVFASASIQLSQYSVDGVNWTSASLPTGNNLQYGAACYGGGVFVSLPPFTNSYHYALYSHNGKTWVTTDISNLAYNVFSGVAYGKGVFVAAISSSAAFAYSYDGITWTEGAMPSTQYWRRPTYYNGLFIMPTYNSSVYAYSTDGLTWIEGAMPSVTMTPNWRYSAAGNGRYLLAIAGNSQYAYSFDGKTWTLAKAGVNIGGVSFGGQYFLAPNETGYRYSFSKDGVTWTSLSQSLYTDYDAMYYGNGLYMLPAPSRSYVRVSPDVEYFYAYTTTPNRYGIAAYNITPTATIRPIVTTANAWSTHTTDILSYMQEVARHKV